MPHELPSPPSQFPALPARPHQLVVPATEADMMAPDRRRKAIGRRRRVEDEGDEDGGPGAFDVDDDSMTEGTALSDDNDAADDSDTSNIDEASPTGPNGRKPSTNGTANHGHRQKQFSRDTETSKTPQAAVADAEVMLGGLDISDKAAPVREINFDDLPVESPSKAEAPMVVSSNLAQRQQPSKLPQDRRRDHDEYRKKRAEDPAFVPNRGGFYMHDHRPQGPAANGFRPFPRPRGGGRGGRGGFAGPFAPINPLHNPADPTVNAPWAHDMHEIVADPLPHRQARRIIDDEGPANGNGIIATRPPNATPINRTLSTEKVIGNVQIRVFLPPFTAPKVYSAVPFKQYTKLPDHRPPLRRDKPVRMSLPDYPPRYVFPAVDRSFIFIPRALRPNQQRIRGRPRSGLGSTSGFSRRTSVYGGSWYGSVYSPSVAISRRSSITQGMDRDYLISPTGSTMSRPNLPVDNIRPVVRLPPLNRPDQPFHGPAPVADPTSAAPPVDKPMAVGESSINDLPPPQTHPLPQKPTFQENRPTQIPMHQPRPQKTVSVENIESPTLSQNPHQSFGQAFHQQVPVQVANGYSHDAHHRHPSYHSTGTPLSQIPERAIHAAPFQPTNPYQPNFYGNHQPYPMMQPQQGYYYPPHSYGNNMPSATAPAFVPASQQLPNLGYNQGGPPAEQAAAQTNGQATVGSNLVAHEQNGMVYYYDPSQMPAVSGFPSYPAPPQGFIPGMVSMSGMNGMNGMVTPSPDGFYYPQPTPGMVYYPQ